MTNFATEVSRLANIMRRQDFRVCGGCSDEHPIRSDPIQSSPVQSSPLATARTVERAQGPVGCHQAFARLGRWSGARVWGKKEGGPTWHKGATPTTEHYEEPEPRRLLRPEEEEAGGSWM